jgi:hypothetical protein
MTVLRPVDEARVLALIAELSETLRRHGFAIDIGDGQFKVYLAESVGNDAVATLSWNEEAQRLEAEFVPDDERWSVEDEAWLRNAVP